MSAETDASTSAWLAPMLIAIGGVFVTAWGAVLNYISGRIDKTDARVTTVETALRDEQRRIWEELNRHAARAAEKHDEAAEKREEIIVRLGNTATRDDLNQMRRSIEHLLQQRTLSQ